MSTKSFGLELEFFVKKDGKFIVAPSSMARDDCGYLAEARGRCDSDPRAAWFLLQAEIDRLKAQAKKEGVELILANTQDIPKEFLRTTLRTFGKNPAKSYFASGRCYTSSAARAGLHIHFGYQGETFYRTFDPGTKESREMSVKYPGRMNNGRVIWLMDNKFKDEIKEAKRIPGEYEFKDYGFEYRSLPATMATAKYQEKVIGAMLEIANDPELYL